MPANNSTSPEEFNKMQEEALERLHEMQKRSRSMVAQPSTESQNSGHGNRSMGNNNNNNSRQGAGSPNHGSQGGSRPQEHSRAAQPAGQTYHGGNLMNTGFSVSEIFKSLLGEAGKLDTDSLLILLMLFTLYKNKADIKLLVALGYILL